MPSLRQPRNRSDFFERGNVDASLRPRRLHRLLKRRKVITVYESEDGKYYLRYVLKPGIDKKLCDLSPCDIDWVQKCFPSKVQARYVREVITPEAKVRNGLLIAMVREFFLRGGARILERLQRRRLPLILRRTADLINIFKWLTAGVSRYQSHRAALNLEEVIERRYRDFDMRRFKVLWSKPVDLSSSDMVEKLHDAFLVARALDVPLEALSGYPILILLHQDGEGMTMLAPHGVVYPTTVKGVLLSLMDRVSGRVLKLIGDYLERIRSTVATVSKARRDVFADSAFPHDMIRGYYEVGKKYLDHSERDVPIEPKLELDPGHLQALLMKFPPSSFEENLTVKDGDYDEEKWSQFIEANY
jgi:hypothetical protein